MVLLFKVWSGDRAIKSFVVIQNATVAELISKSNEKLKIDGVRLTLESDGTSVEDDEVLQLLANETLLLLQNGEVWKKNDDKDSPIMQGIITQEPLTPTNYIESNLATGAQLDNNEENNDFIPNAQNLQNVPDDVVLPRNETVDPVSTANQILNPWSSYEYDWSNIEPCLRDRLERGERSYRLRTQVISRVILNMRTTHTKIPIHVLRNVAEKIVQKYPESFEDRIRDKKYGKGFITLLDAMREHNNYLNRPDRQRPSGSKKKNSMEMMKMMAQARMGTVDWQPDNYPDGENEATLEEKRVQLETIFSGLEFGQPPNEELQQEIISLMKLTYKAQREFLNNFEEPPTPEDVTSSWPILLRKEFIFYHYELLMGHSIEILQNNFLVEKERILIYGSQRNLIESDRQADDYEILKIIFHHFKEDPQNFLVDVPEGQAWTDVELILTGPVIARESLDGGWIYHLIFDGTYFDVSFIFLEAVQWGFATYFIWNRRYPANYAHTLQFLQEVILGLHVEEASKSPNSVKVKSKVNTLFKRLQKISTFQLSGQEDL